jgi:hypothetical protein
MRKVVTRFAAVSHVTVWVVIGSVGNSSETRERVEEEVRKLS